MSDQPDELAAGLRELAEHETSAADERFEAGLRQTMRWEQRRRRTQRRRLLAVSGLLCRVRRAGGRLGAAGQRPAPAAAGRRRAALARRANQRPSGAALSPIGLLGGTEPRTGGAIGIRRQGLAGRPGWKSQGEIGWRLHAECLVVRLGLCAAYGLAEPRRRESGRRPNARSEPESTVTELDAHAYVHADPDSDSDSDLAVSAS